MRVLHVFKTYLPDSFTGIERVIWEICRGTAPHGVRSHVFCLSDRPAGAPLKIGGHWVHQAQTSLEIASTPVALSAWRPFAALARHADIVHYHFPWPMMDLLAMAARPKRPAVVTYHSDIVRQARLLKLYEPLMHRFLARADAIVATSPNYAASSQVLGRHSARLSIIPIGIEAPEAADAALVDKWRSRLPARFFLFVGALRYYKGLSFLIEAARHTGLPVVMAGRGDLPRAETLPGNVHVLGEVSDADKAALLELCDAFVFPSHLRSEAFGIALLEAAFAGRAMISCEIGTGTSYVNRHDETGLVVAPADAEALAAAMRTLWEDGDRRRAFGRAARHRAASLFGAAEMAQAYAGLYRRLAEGVRRSGS